MSKQATLRKGDLAVKGSAYHGIDWPGNSESLSLINSRLVKSWVLFSLEDLQGENILH